MIRIVGLSATLPNYRDVAQFLGVSEGGLFFFDASYRPVPLGMEFVGVSERNIMASKAIMDEICYQKVELGPQVLDAISKSAHVDSRLLKWNPELAFCWAAYVQVPTSFVVLSHDWLPP